MVAAMDHSEHSTASRTSWKTAAQATLHCLTGCAIGEVAGMVIVRRSACTTPGRGPFHRAGVRVRLRAHYAWRPARRGRLPDRDQGRPGADTVSILVMEILDNAFMVVVPGAMDAGLGSALFWLSLAGALVIAFVVTVR